MKTVYLSLGSNLGDRDAHLREALAALAAPKFRTLRESPIYETEPVGYLAQGWFLNMVLEAETGLFPLQLLAHTSRVERELGRVRVIPNGPRKIDVDILLFGGNVIDCARLTVPHPRMAERRFVLAPLADLAPDLRHPVTRRTVREMLADAPSQRIRKHSG